MEKYVKLNITDDALGYKLQISDVDLGTTLVSLNKALAQVIHFWGNDLSKSLGEKLDLLKEMHDLAKWNLENFTENKIKGNELVQVERWDIK